MECASPANEQEITRVVAENLQSLDPEGKVVRQQGQQLAGWGRLEACSCFTSTTLAYFKKKNFFKKSKLQHSSLAKSEECQGIHQDQLSLNLMSAGKRKVMGMLQETPSCRQQKHYSDLHLKSQETFCLLLTSSRPVDHSKLL